MPRIHVETPEVYESIIRPAGISVARDILDRISLDKSIKIIYPGRVDDIATPGSTIGPGSNQLTSAASSQLIVNVVDGYVDSRTMTEPVTRPMTNTVFRDDDLHVYLSPVYHTKEVEISFTLISTDKPTIDRWERSIKSRVAQTQMSTVHKVEYHYPLPSAFMVLLIDIHRRRENFLPRNENIGKWFERCFSDKFTFITNQASLGSTPVIRETQLDIIGWYSFAETPPKPERNEKTGEYQMTFSYKFWIDIVDEVMMFFPNMVHNQFTPREYVDMDIPPLVSNILAQSTMTHDFYNKFSSFYDHGVAWAMTPGIPVPPYEDWLIPPKTLPKYYINLFRFVVDVAEDNRTLIKLDDIGHWHIWELALEYMRNTRLSMTKPYHNIFNVAIYEWDELLDMNKVIVGPDLTISYAEDLDPRKNYHVTLSFLEDPSLLKDDGKDDLADNSCFAKEYFKLFSQAIGSVFPIDMPDCKVPPYVIDDAIDETSKVIDLVNITFWRWYLVGAFTIIARRK